jgi:hypothetical protein
MPMNEFAILQEQVKTLERELRELKQNRLTNLSSTEVELLKKHIIDRTAVGISGGVSRYWVLSINGRRGAVPVYDNFRPLP